MKNKSILIIRVCFFSEKAGILFEKLKSSLPEIMWQPLEDKKNLSGWTKDAFEKSLPLLFISAAGIATRTIAPFVKDKFADSPVLVMDEAGKFVIPVLSGHLGNANEIAGIISNSINAQAVITTGTDVNDKFSIDNFAKLNGFRITERSGIKKVSAEILKGRKISVYVEDGIEIKDKNIPEEIILHENMQKKIDVAITVHEVPDKSGCLINLVPKKYCVGMGCRKGKTFKELKSFAENIFSKKLNTVLKNEIRSLSSINIKQNETGLLELAHNLHVPFVTFTAEELMKAEGDFSESEFVKEKTGTSNVCERAAVLSAGQDGKLIEKKIAGCGMTIAIAERKPSIEIWRQ